MGECFLRKKGNFFNYFCSPITSCCHCSIFVQTCLEGIFFDTSSSRVRLKTSHKSLKLLIPYLTWWNSGLTETLVTKKSLTFLYKTE